MKLNIIIPALEKNKYSTSGDLAPWGDTTLLEWKIYQAKKINNVNNIFVATHSKKIKALCKNLKINVISRKKNISISQLHYIVSKKFKNSYLLWLNPTSPFLSPKIINKFIKNFNKVRSNHDCGIISKKENEYYFFKKKSLNFDSHSFSVSRKKVSELIKITNGAYLANAKISKKKKSLFGNKPYFFQVDWLSSLEIKTTEDLNSFNILIKDYINKYQE